MTWLDSLGSPVSWNAVHEVEVCTLHLNEGQLHSEHLYLHLYLLNNTCVSFFCHLFFLWSDSILFRMSLEWLPKCQTASLFWLCKDFFWNLSLQHLFPAKKHSFGIWHKCWSVTSVWSPLQTTFLTSVLMPHSDQTNRDLILRQFLHAILKIHCIFVYVRNSLLLGKKKSYAEICLQISLECVFISCSQMWTQVPMANFCCFTCLIFHIHPLLEKHCYVKSACFLSQKDSSPDRLFIQCKQGSKTRQK